MVNYLEVETYTDDNGNERICGYGVIINGSDDIVADDDLEPPFRLGKVLERNGDTVTVEIY